MRIDISHIPDVSSVSTARSACENGGDWIRALGLLAEMRKRELTPDMISLNTTMSSCEKGGV